MQCLRRCRARPRTAVNDGENPDQSAEQNQITCGERFRRIEGLREALKRDTEVAMLFISYDLTVVRSLADRMAVLFQGHLFESGEKEAVFVPPFHPCTFALLQAVTDIDRRGRYDPAAGEVVSPVARRACALAGRCPWQLGSKCEEVPPPWREVGGDHHIRCHHESNVLATLAAEASLDLAQLRALTTQSPP